MIYRKRIAFNSTLILSLSTLFLTLTGFSTWKFGVDQNGETETELNVADVINLVDFIHSITPNTEKLKIGVHTFTSLEEMMDYGELKYIIEFDASKLPSSLKAHNVNGVYDFTVYGSLRMDLPLSIFTEDYVYQILVNESIGENNFLIFNNDYTVLNFSFEVFLDQITEQDEENPIFQTLTLSFKFFNKLVLDYRTLGLENNKFILELSAASYVNYQIEAPTEEGGEDSGN